MLLVNKDTFKNMLERVQIYFPSGKDIAFILRGDYLQLLAQIKNLHNELSLIQNKASIEYIGILISIESKIKELNELSKNLLQKEKLKVFKQIFGNFFKLANMNIPHINEIIKKEKFKKFIKNLLRFEKKYIYKETATFRI